MWFKVNSKCLNHLLTIWRIISIRNCHFLSFLQNLIFIKLVLIISKICRLNNDVTPYFFSNFRFILSELKAQLNFSRYFLTSAHLCFRFLVKFSCVWHLRIIQNRWIKLNQTWHKMPLDKTGNAQYTNYISHVRRLSPLTFVNN